MKSKFIIIIFLLFILAILYFNNFNYESMSNVSSIASLEKMLLNRKKKFKNDNVNLTNITTINADSLAILNNKLFNSNLRIIKANTKVRDIKTILLLKKFGDIIYNNNNSLLELKSLKNRLLNIVNSIYDKLNGKVACNLKDFLKYCKNGKVTTRKESFSNINRSIKNIYLESVYARKGKLIENFGDAKIVTDFKNISIKDSLLSFRNTKNSILLDLINTFKSKENKNYDVFNKADLIKLVNIFIKDLKKVLSEIKNLIKTKSNNIRLKKLVKMFIPKRNLFYHLKHYYKILSIYLLFEKLIDNEDQKNLASQCCSDSTDKEIKCYNFASNLKKSNPLVYGYSKYGYVKKSSCVTEDYYNQNLDNIIIDQFDKPIIFDKNKLLEGVYSMLSYHNIIIDGKKKNLSAINLIELIKLKSLLEIDDSESVFFNLGSKIEKAVARMRKEKIYNQERLLREKKNQIYREEKELAERKEDEMRRNKLKEKKLNRERESKRQLLFLKEEKEIKERNRLQKVRKENLFLQEEAILNDKRKERAYNEQLLKMRKEQEFYHQEMVEKAKREEKLEKKRRERKQFLEEERLIKARKKAEKRNKELNLQARKHKMVEKNKLDPKSERARLISKKRELLKRMRKDRPNRKLYIKKIKAINKIIRSL
jgi:hypothetical protein